jgi:hypothetical protein
MSYLSRHRFFMNNPKRTIPTKSGRELYKLDVNKLTLNLNLITSIQKVISLHYVRQPGVTIWIYRTLHELYRNLKEISIKTEIMNIKILVIAVYNFMHLVSQGGRVTRLVLGINHYCKIILVELKIFIETLRNSTYVLE